MPGRAAMWLGHYSLAVLWAAIALTAAADATGQHDPLEIASGVAWVVWFAAWSADGAVHQERLCGRCAASAPTGGQAEAARLQAVLRAHHSPVASTAMLAGVIAGEGASFILRDFPVIAATADAAAVILLGVSVAITARHRRLHRWCPWCRWDEGGEHEPSPDVPAPALSR
jgi:hypothetical protein